MSTPAVIKPREIRVFLSSTFKDMEVERNHLIKSVFPKVRAACQARQVGFTEIDLRWGVTEEQSQNGATVEICLSEIDRCRDFPPFFIGFLGERYGWIPRESDLSSFWERHSDSIYQSPIRAAVARGISVTELEMELGVLGEGAAERLHGQALFLLRERSFTDQIYAEATGRPADPSDPSYYDPAGDRLATLKARIRNSAFLELDGYTDIAQFGQAIEGYLMAQLEQHFPLDVVPSPFERMQAAHAVFRFHRLHNFLPRPEIVEQVLQALIRRQAKPALGPLLLAGPSGQGKSALMADLASRLTGGDTHWECIDHYIGADDRSSLAAWIERLLLTLHPLIEDLTGPVPESEKGRKEALAIWISYAARRREQALGKPVRYLLVLDALDQLVDGGKDLSLLQAQILGADALLLVSAADETPARESSRAWEAINVPPLSDAMKARFIANTLARYRKALPPEWERTLAHAPQAGSPLFLGLALEELRLDARHESLPALIGHILESPDAAHLFLHRFLLDGDYGRPGQPDLACRFMALIGAARNGLTEDELADLLALPEDPISANTGRPRLAAIHLSRLITVFQPFLLDKDGNRAPMHRSFGEAALEYCGTTPVRKHLYSHFKGGYGKGKQPFAAGSAGEALFQVTKMADGPEGKQRLTNDVANLPAMAKLCGVDENVVADALAQFSFEEMAALGRRWLKQVTAEHVSRRSTSIDWFSKWISDRIGHYSISQTIQERMLALRRSLLGDDHEITLGNMIGLSFTLKLQGNLAKARTLIESVLNVRRRLLGGGHYRTHLTMTMLAHVLEEQGEFAAALMLRESVFAATRKRLGDEHAVTIVSMINLADTLHANGNLPEARALRQSILDAHLRLYGKSHKMTLHAMAELALSHFASNELSDARALQERAVSGLSLHIGGEHPETLTRKIELSNTLSRLGDLAGARDLQTAVLQARSRFLNRDHPLLLETKRILAITSASHLV